MFWADKIILTETSLMGFHQPLYHAYASPKIWMRKWFYVYSFPWFLLSCTYNIGNPIFVIAWQGIFNKLLDGHTNFTNYYPFPQEGFILLLHRKKRQSKILSGGDYFSKIMEIPINNPSYIISPRIGIINCCGFSDLQIILLMYWDITYQFNTN